MMDAAEMFMVVVMSLAGNVENVVGPFWYEDTADMFAQEVAHKGKRSIVRRVIERQEWRAAQ